MIPIKKEELPDLLYDVINSMGKSANLIDILKTFYTLHKTRLKISGDLFYTWQYDIRWAATKLRNDGRMKPTTVSPKGFWEII